MDFDLYCFHKRFVGDGVCDDPNNNPYCFFDGGDCCLADSDTSFCKDCFCYLEENDTIDSGCAIFEWILFRAIGSTENLDGEGGGTNNTLKSNFLYHFSLHIS